MRGAVVINGYLNSGSFREPADMMVEAGKRHEVPFSVIQNTDLVCPIGDADSLSERLGDVDFVVFWDKDVDLARNLEVCGYPVVNCSECIRICDDKAQTHMTLAEYGIPTIETMVSPMTFGHPVDGWADRVKEEFGFPLVAKDRFGSFGEGVRLIRDEEGLRKETSDGVQRLFQPYVECGSQDLRLQVVGERVVASVKRIAPEGDFRANASIGGKMVHYKPTEDEKELAVEAAAAVQADFAGVDIIQSKDGPLVCEVNSNAHITNLRNATGVDVADIILEHIIGLLG